MIGTAKIIGRQLYLQIELIRAGNVPAYFVKFSRRRSLSGFLPPWLVDSGTIVTFETGHPAIALQRVKAPRTALASGYTSARTPRVAKRR